MELQDFKKKYVQEELGIKDEFGKILVFIDFGNVNYWFADFVYLLRYLKQKGKKVILIKAGHVVHQLKEVAHLVVNAQDIKKYIADVKQKPGARPGLADRDPESTGRTTVKS